MYLLCTFDANDIPHVVPVAESAQDSIELAMHSILTKHKF